MCRRMFGRLTPSRPSSVLLAWSLKPRRDRWRAPPTSPASSWSLGRAIPTEVGCSVPEPVEPFVEAEPLQDPAVNVIALAAMPDRAPVAVLFPPVQWGPCWIRCSPHWTVPQRCQALGTPCSMNWGAGFGRTS
jgi:hypothetical protein